MTWNSEHLTVFSFLWIDQWVGFTVLIGCTKYKIDNEVKKNRKPHTIRPSNIICTSATKTSLKNCAYIVTAKWYQKNLSMSCLFVEYDSYGFQHIPNTALSLSLVEIIWQGLQLRNCIEYSIFNTVIQNSISKSASITLWSSCRFTHVCGWRRLHTGAQTALKQEVVTRRCLTTLMKKKDNSTNMVLMIGSVDTRHLRGGPTKNVALYFCTYLRQLLTDFQNSFTGTLCRQFALMRLLHLTTP